MSSKNNDLFGGMFDFNGDGKTSIDEEYLAYKIFEESTNKDNDDVDEDDDYGYGYDTDDDVPTYHSAPKTTQVVTPRHSSKPEVYIPEPLSKENYSGRKSEVKARIVFSVIGGMLLSVLPVLIMWAAIASVEEVTGAGILASFIFLIGGLIFLGYIWHNTSVIISGRYGELKSLNENYIKLLSEEEISELNKRKHKSKVRTTCIIVAVSLVLIAIPIIKTVKISVTYNKAVSLVDSASYEMAEEIFKEIEDKHYRDTSAYLLLCEAHKDYNAGYIPSAHYALDKANFHYLSKEQKKEVNDFSSKLKTEYDAYIKRKSESETKAYHDRIAYGVPYVGMSESQINNTSLGAPSSNVRHNYECINGQQYLANLYDFKQGGSTVFTARCVRGKVTEVWDNRNKPASSYTPKKKVKQKQSDDPYDVNDYSNEEDFYYDHYDDFFDYYDAEDYYNEHHE